jgi:5-methylcytosine-specific restriction endonuclease McrA
MARGRTPLSFETFVEKYLVENFTDTKGKPKHTRLVKGHFYDFANELLEAYGLDMYKCSECGITHWNDRPIVMQLDHINGIVNDSRIDNLRMLCPNCHSQTHNYCGRKTPHDDHVEKLKARKK